MKKKDNNVRCRISLSSTLTPMTHGSWLPPISLSVSILFPMFGVNSEVVMFIVIHRRCFSQTRMFHSLPTLCRQDGSAFPVRFPPHGLFVVVPLSSRVCVPSRFIHLFFSPLIPHSHCPNVSLIPYQMAFLLCFTFPFLLISR